MRSRSSLLAMALVVLGCGDGVDVEEVALGDRLQGIWQVESAASACGNMYAFYGDKFEMVSYCERDDGRIWAEKYEGTYVLSGTSDAVMTVQRSSCPNALRHASARVDFIDEMMTLSSGSEAIMLEPASRATVRAGGARVEFGCLDSQGRFAPAPVRDLT